MNNYRAWHDESKEYVYFDYKKMAKDQFQSQIFMDLAIQDKLEQSTGLFDKNGKEIFVGDIMRRIYHEFGSGEQKEIFFTVSKLTDLYGDKIEKDDAKCSMTLWSTDFEIIGNIHEEVSMVKFT